MNVYVRQTALAFSNRGWNVDVFTRVHPDRVCTAAVLAPGIRLLHIPAGPALAGKDKLHRWIDPFASGVADWIRSSELSYRAFLSHYWLSGLAAIVLARQATVPHLASFHTLSLVKQKYFPQEKAEPVRIAGEQRVVAEANLLVANSDHERSALQEFYAADAERIIVAPPAINADHFRPGDRGKARIRLGLATDDRIVVCVGRDSAIKGVDVLRGALKRMRQPVTALLIGDHAVRCGSSGQLQRRGVVANEHLRDFYLAADACVIPSLYESSGMVAREALACGCPVVASRVGGLPGIVDEGINGLLVTPGDAVDLAVALETVLAHAKKFRADTSVANSWADTASQLVSAIHGAA